MCGIFYCSQDIHIDPTYLELRGPDQSVEFTNHLGKFFHARLSTNPLSDIQPYNINDNIIMINGTIYNTLNEKTYFEDFEYNNLDHLHEQIRTLDGEFALCIINENEITLATDYFGTKPLYFYYDDDCFFVSSVRSVILNHCPTVYSMPKNTIFTFKKNKPFRLVKQSIYFEFDLNQKHNHWDYVHEQFDKTMRKMINQPLLTGISVSSGLDSGVLDCWLIKNNPIKAVVTHINPNGEDKEILLSRSKLRDCVNHPISHMVDQSDIIKASYGGDNLYLTRGLWNKGVGVFGAVMQTIKNYGVKIYLSGSGGDDLYSDNAQNNKPHNSHSVIHGHWPSDLKTVWPWFDEYKWLNSEIFLGDFVGGINGLESRFPLIDKDLVQSWLNTTHHIKNSGYKAWITEYMKLYDYPYTLNKYFFDDNE